MILIIVTGSLKHYIVCATSDSRLVWISTTRPGFHRQFAFKPSNLFLDLVIFSWKVELLGLF